MNGGAFFIFLLGVLVVFGAGYLYAENNRGELFAAANGQQIQTLEAREATSQADIKRYLEENNTYRTALVGAESERNRLSTLQANTGLQAYGQGVALSTAVADRNSNAEALSTTVAQRNAAIDELDRANQNAVRLQSTVTVLEQQIAGAPQIPVVGGVSTEHSAGSAKIIPAPASPWLGFIVFGVVVFAGAYSFGRISSKPQGKVQYAKDVTTVVMSVEAAREYARGKTARAKTHRKS